MEGYSVTEAASILGVPTERVWELLARGVLAGVSEGEAGMRVFLQPRPAPAPAPIANEPGRANGNADSREPERELSPFRELLTEFRNLTERYGQALLALGESRGEVATLRSRVDLLEARMDLRLPMAGFTPPAPSSPWPAASAERAVSPRPEEAADEHGVEEGEEDHDRPARRRRSSQRRATEAFAEALARAEDPTRSELPGASDVATALAALRDEPGHAAGASATEAVLPRELPAADPMPLADEASEPEVVAAAPEPVAVERPELEPEVARRPEPAAEPGVPAEPEPAAVETPETEPEVVGDAPEPVAIERPEPERELVVEPEPEPDVEAVEPEPVAIVEPEPEPEPEVAASEPEPEPEPEVAASGPEPVVVEQPEVVAAEPEPVVVEPEPVVVEQPEPATEPESVAGEPDRVTVEPVAEVPSGLDVTLIEEPEAEPTPPPAATADVPAVPAAEASPGLEPDDQPAPEAVAVSPEPEREADAVETEMAEQPIGDELEAEEVDVDLEPIGAPSVDGMPEPALDENVAADAASVTDQPDAAEPIRWDRERYTVDIVEPDWYAGEEPQPADPAVRDEARATDDDAPRATDDDAPEPEAAHADADSLELGAAAPAPEPEPPPSAARHDEETMLWFGRQPAAPPADEPANAPPPVDEGADDGASEMEVAGSGRRAAMPGSQELDEALAALDAVGRNRGEPASDAPDEPVEEMEPEAWPRADTSGWASPPPSSQPHPTPTQPTPASRAYRRLRRIFPG